MDAGAGSCILKEEKYARIVADALRYFNNERYILDEWVIMPNHVHILVKPINNYSLTDILHSWKSYTANEINKLSGNKGQLWMHESYDHIVRNEKALEAIRDYIRQNPIKAGIVLPERAQGGASRNAGGIIRSKDAPATIRSKDAPATATYRLRQLLSYSDEVPEFSDDEKKEIISAIDNIKILDPACGSGAFPMGILHKLVHALQKLDPENKYWYELQYKKALKESEEVFKQGDKKQREERLKEINEAFDEGINYPDYARKLYLIENCIYGVDIQPIAIQISKLRFFISLVLDQKVDRNKENCGIRALPNLETKFVAANTLIGLDKPDHLFYTDKIKKLEEEIKSLRHKYFTAKTRSEKIDYQKKDKELRRLLAKELKNIGFPTDSSEKIAKFDLYDQNATADFFDPEWMFGIVAGTSSSSKTGAGSSSYIGGFDIVIANPPYIRQEVIKDQKEILKKQNYEVFNSTSDIYTYFYEKGWQVLKANGILCFISSNKWMRAKYGEKLRRFFKEKTTLKKIIDFNGYRVFEATVDTNILLFQKVKPTDNTISILNIEPDFTKGTDITNYFQDHNIKMKQSELDEKCFTFGDEAMMKLKAKIEKAGIPLKDWDAKIYFGIKTGLNDAFIITSEKRNEILANCKDEAELQRTEAIFKPILRGRDIKRYYYRWAGMWMIVIPAGWTKQKVPSVPSSSLMKEEIAEVEITNLLPSLMNHLFSYKEKAKKRDDQGDYWWELRHCAYYSEFEKEKIVWQEISDEPSFAIDTHKFYTDQTAYIATGEKLKYIIACLNSKFCYYYLKQIAYLLSGKASRWIKQYVDIIPLPSITPANQPIVAKIESLVDQILSITKVTQPSGLSGHNSKQDACDSKQAKVREYEEQIDQMVYKLYGLTEEEIKIVEGGIK